MKKTTVSSMMGLFFFLISIGSSASLTIAGDGGTFIYVCENVSTKATITFISHGDMSKWIDDVSGLRWGIALSRDDIVKVAETNEKAYNQPNVSMDALDSKVILSNIPTHKQQSVQIDPGVYDWIILVDNNGDGRHELYLGTTASSVQLDSFTFEANKTYNIVVDEETHVSMSVTDLL